jgi:hypothetical protein
MKHHSHGNDTNMNTITIMKREKLNTIVRGNTTVLRRDVLMAMGMKRKRAIRTMKTRCMRHMGG